MWKPWPEPRVGHDDAAKERSQRVFSAGSSSCSGRLCNRPMKGTPDGPMPGSGAPVLLPLLPVPGEDRGDARRRCQGLAGFHRHRRLAGEERHLHARSSSASGAIYSDVPLRTSCRRWSAFGLTTSRAKARSSLSTRRCRRSGTWRRPRSRHLTPKEQALIRGIRQRTFVMFEEQLRAAGDPGADPDIARAK